jgi:hypothetical protein
MNYHAARRDEPAPIFSASTPTEARKLAANLIDLMSTLLAVIERETELVRAGKVREAMALEPNKTDLTRRYAKAIEQLKASQKYLSQTAPELLTTLHDDHDTVSESIVRGVNSQMQQRNIPNTYTASGRRSAPGPRHITPLTLSRSL